MIAKLKRIFQLLLNNNSPKSTKNRTENWKEFGFAVGGLRFVGFAPGTDLLLVLSSQGEGIFDCINGTRIAREYNNEDWYDRLSMEQATITGFGPLKDYMISVTGEEVEGDKIPKSNTEGWSLMRKGPAPVQYDFGRYEETKIWLISPDKKEKTLLGSDGPCELVAYGFSDTGKSCIMASSCELNVFTRI